ncbi:replicase polyprotein 1ab [Wobbly possum disease virus]|uniref:Replicase polyprotein 1ab n=1 Tax=Wobbly possum disease virus TaxID=1118369 RepID=G9FGR6_9NIDO|nr:replicase polyprotein 1ab [Wobbly possum disease virus]AEU12347.3 replicase polyprotein 1ab [Wobbly possum disease virus]
MSSAQGSTSYVNHIIAQYSWNLEQLDEISRLMLPSSRYAEMRVPGVVVRDATVSTVEIDLMGHKLTFGFKDMTPSEYKDFKMDETDGYCYRPFTGLDGGKHPSTRFFNTFGGFDYCPSSPCWLSFTCDEGVIKYHFGKLQTGYLPLMPVVPGKKNNLLHCPVGLVGSAADALKKRYGISFPVANKNGPFSPDLTSTCNFVYHYDSMTQTMIPGDGAIVAYSPVPHEVCDYMELSYNREAEILNGSLGTNFNYVSGMPFIMASAVPVPGYKPVTMYVKDNMCVLNDGTAAPVIYVLNSSCNGYCYLKFRVPPVGPWPTLDECLGGDAGLTYGTDYSLIGAGNWVHITDYDKRTGVGISLAVGWNPAFAHLKKARVGGMIVDPQLGSTSGPKQCAVPEFGPQTAGGCASFVRQDIMTPTTGFVTIVDDHFATLKSNPPPDSFMASGVPPAIATNAASPFFEDIDVEADGWCGYSCLAKLNGFSGSTVKDSAIWVARFATLMKTELLDYIGRDLPADLWLTDDMIVKHTPYAVVTRDQMHCANVLGVMINNRGHWKCRLPTYRVAPETACSGLGCVHVEPRIERFPTIKYDWVFQNSARIESQVSEQDLLNEAFIGGKVITDQCLLSEITLTPRSSPPPQEPRKRKKRSKQKPVADPPAPKKLTDQVPEIKQPVASPVPAPRLHKPQPIKPVVPPVPAPRTKKQRPVPAPRKLPDLVEKATPVAPAKARFAHVTNRTAAAVFEATVGWSNSLKAYVAKLPRTCPAWYSLSMFLLMALPPGLGSVLSFVLGAVFLFLTVSPVPLVISVTLFSWFVLTRPHFIQCSSWDRECLATNGLPMPESIVVMNRGSAGLIGLVIHLFAYAGMSRRIFATLRVVSVAVDTLALYAAYVLDGVLCFKCFHQCARTQKKLHSSEKAKNIVVNNTMILQFMDTYAPPPVDLVKLATGVNGCHCGSKSFIQWSTARPVAYSRYDPTKSSAETVLPLPKNAEQALRVISHALEHGVVVFHMGHTGVDVKRIEAYPASISPLPDFFPDLPYTSTEATLVVDVNLKAALSACGYPDMDKIVVGEGDWLLENEVYPIGVDQKRTCRYLSHHVSPGLWKNLSASDRATLKDLNYRPTSFGFSVSLCRVFALVQIVAGLASYFVPVFDCGIGTYDKWCEVPFNSPVKGKHSLAVCSGATCVSPDGVFTRDPVFPVAICGLYISALAAAAIVISKLRISVGAIVTVIGSVLNYCFFPEYCYAGPLIFLAQLFMPWTIQSLATAALSAFLWDPTATIVVIILVATFMVWSSCGGSMASVNINGPVVSPLLLMSNGTAPSVVTPTTLACAAQSAGVPFASLVARAAVSRPGTVLKAAYDSAKDGKVRIYIPTGTGVVQEGAMRCNRVPSNVGVATGATTGTASGWSYGENSRIITATHVTGTPTFVTIGTQTFTIPQFNTNGDFAYVDINGNYGWPEYKTGQFEGPCFWLTRTGVETGAVVGKAAVAFTHPGDSGSPVVTKDNVILGVHSASNQRGLAVITDCSGVEIGYQPVQLSKMVKLFSGPLTRAPAVMPANIVRDIESVPETLANALNGQLNYEGGLPILVEICVAVVMIMLAKEPVVVLSGCFIFLLSNMLPRMVARACYNVLLAWLSVTPGYHYALALRCAEIGMAGNFGSALLYSLTTVAAVVLNGRLALYPVYGYTTVALVFAFNMLCVALHYYRVLTPLSDAVFVRCRFNVLRLVRHLMEGSPESIMPVTEAPVLPLSAVLTSTFSTEELDFLAQHDHVFVKASNLAHNEALKRQAVVRRAINLWNSNVVPTKHRVRGLASLKDYTTVPVVEVGDTVHVLGGVIGLNACGPYDVEVTKITNFFGQDVGTGIVRAVKEGSGNPAVDRAMMLDEADRTIDRKLNDEQAMVGGKVVTLSPTGTHSRVDGKGFTTPVSAVEAAVARKLLVQESDTNTEVLDTTSGKYMKRVNAKGDVFYELIEEGLQEKDVAKLRKAIQRLQALLPDLNRARGTSNISPEVPLGFVDGRDITIVPRSRTFICGAFNIKVLPTKEEINNTPAGSYDLVEGCMIRPHYPSLIDKLLAAIHGSCYVTPTVPVILKNPGDTDGCGHEWDFEELTVPRSRVFAQDIATALRNEAGLMTIGYPYRMTPMNPAGSNRRYVPTLKGEGAFVGGYYPAVGVSFPMHAFGLSARSSIDGELTIDANGTILGIAPRLKSTEKLPTVPSSIAREFSEVTAYLPRVDAKNCLADLLKYRYNNYGRVFPSVLQIVRKYMLRYAAGPIYKASDIPSKDSHAGLAATRGLTTKALQALPDIDHKVYMFNLDSNASVTPVSPKIQYIGKVKVRTILGTCAIPALWLRASMSGVLAKLKPEPPLMLGENKFLPIPKLRRYRASVDVVSCDRTTPACIRDFCASLFDEMCGAPDFYINYHRHCVSEFIAFDGKIFVKPGGLSSGDPVTTLSNCVYSLSIYVQHVILSALRLNYRPIAEKYLEEELTVEDCMDWVPALIYGDDVVLHTDCVTGRESFKLWREHFIFFSGVYTREEAVEAETPEFLGCSVVTDDDKSRLVPQRERVLRALAFNLSATDVDTYYQRAEAILLDASAASDQEWFSSILDRVWMCAYVDGVDFPSLSFFQDFYKRVSSEAIFSCSICRGNAIAFCTCGFKLCVKHINIHYYPPEHDPRLPCGHRLSQRNGRFDCIGCGGVSNDRWSPVEPANPNLCEVLGIWLATEYTHSQRVSRAVEAVFDGATWEPQLPPGRYVTGNTRFAVLRSCAGFETVPVLSCGTHVVRSVCIDLHGIRLQEVVEHLAASSYTCGPPGSGKSRLLSAKAQERQSTIVTPSHVCCDEYIRNLDCQYVNSKFYQYSKPSNPNARIHVALASSSPTAYGALLVDEVFMIHPSDLFRWVTMRPIFCVGDHNQLAAITHSAMPVKLHTLFGKTSVLDTIHRFSGPLVDVISHLYSTKLTGAGPNCEIKFASTQPPGSLQITPYHRDRAPDGKTVDSCQGSTHDHIYLHVPRRFSLNKNRALVALTRARYSITINDPHNELSRVGFNIPRSEGQTVPLPLPAVCHNAGFYYSDVPGYLLPLPVELRDLWPIVTTGPVTHNCLSISITERPGYHPAICAGYVVGDDTFKGEPNVASYYYAIFRDGVNVTPRSIFSSGRLLLNDRTAYPGEQEAMDTWPHVFKGDIKGHTIGGCHHVTSPNLPQDLAPAMFRAVGSSLPGKAAKACTSVFDCYAPYLVDIANTVTGKSQVVKVTYDLAEKRLMVWKGATFYFQGVCYRVLKELAGQILLPSDLPLCLATCDDIETSGPVTTVCKPEAVHMFHYAKSGYSVVSVPITQPLPKCIAARARFTASGPVCYVFLDNTGALNETCSIGEDLRRPCAPCMPSCSFAPRRIRLTHPISTSTPISPAALKFFNS